MTINVNFFKLYFVIMLCCLGAANANNGLLEYLGDIKRSLKNEGDAVGQSPKIYHHPHATRVKAYGDRLFAFGKAERLEDSFASGIPATTTGGGVTATWTTTQITSTVLVTTTDGDGNTVTRTTTTLIPTRIMVNAGEYSHSVSQSTVYLIVLAVFSAFWWTFC